jgi:hypothetical protein
MRVWNLNEPDALNDVVVEELAKSKRARSHVYRGAEFQSLKAIVGVASVMFTVSFSTLVVNHGSVRLPNWGAAIARSAPDLRAPLEGVFGNRFNREWTPEIENSLLGQIVEKSLTASRKSDSIEAFISSNLQEDITLDGPRLTSATVARIVRNQKTS